ncbi:MAG: malate synthase G, partial [Gammaproteobacteria bacterium]|nr:malate synthase G [Gammaproteobacteria bacterium]
MSVDQRVHVDSLLHQFVGREALPGTGVAEDAFWRGFAALLAQLAPANAALLQRRDELQARIDAFHTQRPGASFDRDAYASMLRESGYLVAEPESFRIDTANVDPEIALTAGPQLVVPINNARYALNAANARWGSLYDALYGTDAIAEDAGAERTNAYNPARGARVVAFGRDFLDRHFPLAAGSHREAAAYRIDGEGIEVRLAQGGSTRLRDAAAF